MDHIIDGPPNTSATAESVDDLARVTGHRRSRARQAAAHRQAARLRLVAPAYHCLRSTIRSLRRWRRRGTAAGTGCSRTSATTSTTSGIAPTSRSRATPSSSRRSASRCSTCSRQGPAPSARDRGQGADRPRLRRSHVLGHRDVRPAGADLHGSARGARRAALAPPDARARARTRALARTRTAQRSRGARSTDRSARATGRRGPRRSTSTPTSPTRSVRYQLATRRRGVRSAATASSCWSRRRGCGARSGTTTPTGSFRIDGVTGPDEYSAIADNNVYTNLMAQRNLRAAADAARASPRCAPLSWASTTRRPPRWRDAADAMHDSLRRGAAGPPAGGGVHRARGVGLRSHTRPSSIRCCCTSRTSTCIASRSSSRPISCSRCTCAATPSPMSRRRATSTTTSR